MAGLAFEHQVCEQGVVLSLSRQGLLIRKRTIPVDQWPSEANDIAFAGISYVLGLLEADNGEARSYSNSVTVTHKSVAGMSEPQADALGLPPAVPFILNLRADGIVSDPQFTLKVRWIDHANRPVQVTRQGAFLAVADANYRVPEPMFSICESVQAFGTLATQDDGKRLAAIARLQELLPEEGGKRLVLDPFLRDLRVLHATAFSLSLSTDGKGFQFDPVLFGRHVVDRIRSNDADIAELEGVIVSEAEGLLTDHQQQVFAKQRFVQNPEARDRYVIESGVYVYVDRPLQAALSVVRRLQGGTDEERKRFARSPQLFLKDALRGLLDDEAVEHLFIETEQYSARVIDIGLWSPPVLPWIVRDPNDWLPERFGIQIGDTYITLAPDALPDLRTEIERAIEEGRSSVRHGEYDIPATKQTIDALVNLIGIVKPSTDNTDAVEPDVEPEKPHKHILIVSQNFEQIDFTRELQPRADNTAWEFPLSVKTSPKPHQNFAVSWLVRAWAKGYPGVLLADDMGLGKTFSSLVFLAWLDRILQERKGRRSNPFLIVAPTGLLRNWQDEHALHLHPPGLGEVCQAYGSNLRRLRSSRSQDIQTGVPSLDHRALREADWVLTTYETLRDYHFSFAKIRFGCVVFDEMQKVKNPGSLITTTFRSINADFMIGLTGTPIENRLEDLWSIMDILSPGRLGDLKNFSATYSPEDLDSLGRLRSLLLDDSPEDPAPVLRRLKVDHLEGLPQKNIHVCKRMMPEVQAKAYAEVVQKAKSSDSGSMLEVLHHLRGISLHPVWPNMNTATDADAYIAQSARLAETIAILDKIRDNGEKVLIFLESLDMQDQLAVLLKQRYALKKRPLQINGHLSGDKRKQAVDEFQEEKTGFSVIILSPKAGGVGLTLTAANHVIHLSRWWNPAVEDQCTDRIYRIGQTKPVNVYYPMAVHPEFGDSSFDEILNSLLERKRDVGRRMLIPPVNLAEDQAWFAQRLGRAVPAMAAITIEEIDQMDPLQFERWAISRLAAYGYIADKTPHSNDKGGDGVLVHKVTKQKVILQCKLKLGEKQICDDTAIDQLVNAKGAYGPGVPKLIALTNAPMFTSKAKKRAKDFGIRLVPRDQLPSWPDGHI